jgi:hypothetical protein
MQFLAKTAKQFSQKKAKRLYIEKCVPGLKFHLPQNREIKPAKFSELGRDGVASKLAKQLRECESFYFAKPIGERQT